MFTNWGFLLSEMAVLLALAAGVGLIAGWILWGRRSAPDTSQESRLLADLAACRRAGEEKSARIAELEDRLAAAKADRGASAPASDTGELTQAHPERTHATMPTTLDAPRGDRPDDLTLIRGVGPKLMAMVNGLGFYHFDQIAAWTPAEVAWVDENLTGFKGRVSRDNWVEQATILATGGTTEFANRQRAKDD
ncbi:hypothetical protein [Maritimibacter sp. DP1N21-5]|uniref:hypothetical protein n=1 Tax=Maritimibacter sp. DP1N21-5 TaxID=2836867 RepID=UPI001C455DFB|nr:hypothetical protein [Maritimibacter sp. DP1N21-5]MBV7408374.1 hypothetical protein [Maritimibacter sp. DP1N21-5]